MSPRLKRFIAASAIAVGVVGGASSAVGGPGQFFAGHKQGPGCHGTNQVVCRPDPQPLHGNDCGTNSKHPLNSNDHCGEIPL